MKKNIIISGSLTALMAVSLVKAADVIHPNDAAEFDALLKNKKIVIAKFEADWCGPCQLSKKPFAEIAAATSDPDVAFVAVDIDKLSDLAKRYDVASIPTLVYFVHGHKTDHDTGMTTVGEFKQNLRMKIEKLGGKVVKATEVAAGEAKEEAKEVGAEAKSFFGSLVGSITGFIKGILNFVKGIFETIIDKIKGIFGR